MTGAICRIKSIPFYPRTRNCRWYKIIIFNCYESVFIWTTQYSSSSKSVDYMRSKAAKNGRRHCLHFGLSFLVNPFSWPSLVRWSLWAIDWLRFNASFNPSGYVFYHHPGVIVLLEKAVRVGMLGLGTRPTISSRKEPVRDAAYAGTAVELLGRLLVSLLITSRLPAGAAVGYLMARFIFGSYWKQIVSFGQ